MCAEFQKNDVTIEKYIGVFQLKCLQLRQDAFTLMQIADQIHTEKSKGQYAIPKPK